MTIEIEVEGGEAGGGLRDVERLGRVQQLLFELLALGDVGDGADDARGAAVGVVDDLTGSIGAPGVDGGAQLAHDGFQVFGVNGRDPFLARQGTAALAQADEIEVERGATDAAGTQVQIEHAEAARSRGKL